MGKAESSAGAHAGRKGFRLGDSGSTGIHSSHNQKLVGQSSSQVAKTESRRTKREVVEEGLRLLIQTRAPFGGFEAKFDGETSTGIV